jgi:sulfoquinovose isomerase
MPQADDVPGDGARGVSGEAPGDPTWRAAEFDRLLDFAEAALVPGCGFGWLDDDGHLENERPFELWITARMTHVFSLAALRGRPGAERFAAAGVELLGQRFADGEHDGWFRSVDAAGQPVDDAKACYEHAFVLLASSSATAAHVTGAGELFTRASAVVTRRFWREEEQRCVERYDRSWSELEAYRGANSNMHSVEAFLAAAAAAPDAPWLERALGIATQLIDGAARANRWRLPEHYDPDWHPQPEYNHDRPRDQFRHFGATPGHALEWARLCVDLDASRPDSPAWLVEAAEALFATAVETAWAVDGRDGFVYTVDWSDQPVVSERMHWVAAEAVLAADALYRHTGNDRYREWSERWWAHIERDFVDRDHGSWHHELDRDLRPSSSVWSGKPDAYHAAQAVLLPGIPLAPAPAWALRTV